MNQHKFERIDKGQKRPRTRQGLITKPSHTADLGSWNIPADLNPDEVINQYLTEATTSQIAKQHGVSRKALTAWIRSVRRNEWRNAQIVRALVLKDDSVDGLAAASDALSLARARELLRSAQFDLQALDDDFKPKQDVTHRAPDGPVISIVLAQVVSTPQIEQEIPIESTGASEP